MKELFDRVFRNWKTTVAGLVLAVGKIWVCYNGGGGLDCIADNWYLIIGAFGLGSLAKD